MKVLHSSLFRSLATLAVGILLIVNPSQTAAVMVRLVGLLFTIPGIVSVYTYFSSGAEERSSSLFLPLIGAGSTLLGLLLILYTDYFITITPYVMGASLLIASTIQIGSLWRFRKFFSVSPWRFAAPLVVFLTSLFMLISPVESVLSVLGIAMLAYAVSEGLIFWSFRPPSKPLPPPLETEDP